MARPQRTGLDYFPFDTDFFEDIKIRKLIRYQTARAISVYALLLCLIYRNGYFMLWDKELSFILSEKLGFEQAYIQEVINSCVNIGLFSKPLYENDKVLTSESIQKRFFSAYKSARRRAPVDCRYVIKRSDEIGNEDKDVVVDSDGIIDSKNGGFYGNNPGFCNNNHAESCDNPPKCSNNGGFYGNNPSYCGNNPSYCGNNDTKVNKNKVNKKKKKEKDVQNAAITPFPPVQNEMEERDKEERLRLKVYDTYYLVKKNPSSFAAQTIKEWQKDGTLDKLGLEPLFK